MKKLSIVGGSGVRVGHLFFDNLIDTCNIVGTIWWLMLIRSESQSVSDEILGQNEIMEMRNKSGGDRPPPFFFMGV